MDVRQGQFLNEFLAHISCTCLSLDTQTGMRLGTMPCAIRASLLLVVYNFMTSVYPFITASLAILNPPSPISFTNSNPAKSAFPQTPLPSSNFNSHIFMGNFRGQLLTQVHQFWQVNTFVSIEVERDPSRPHLIWLSHASPRKLKPLLQVLHRKSSLLTALAKFVALGPQTSSYCPIGHMRHACLQHGAKHMLRILTCRTSCPTSVTGILTSGTFSRKLKFLIIRSPSRSDHATLYRDHLVWANIKCCGEFIIFNLLEKDSFATSIARRFGSEPFVVVLLRFLYPCFGIQECIGLRAAG